jgi:hypothetical protein
VTGTTSWERWLAEKDPETQERARVLLGKFRAAGCSADPEGWVTSEIDEDFAQLARFVFLRRVWEGEIEQWRGTTRLEGWPLAQKLVDGKGSMEDLAHLCGIVVTESVFDILTLVDDDFADLLDSDLPGWRLMEVDRSTGEMTGREVAALHESLSEVADEGDPFL